jgi:outer membrane protein OmpA-like peptidoglycan-associated protein
MKSRPPSDHLSSSMTDLMTSLMVIFVLLLVTKLNNQASSVERAVDYVVKAIEAKPQLFRNGEQIKKEADVIVLIVPNELMSFRQAYADQGGANLTDAGKAYLKERIPMLSSVICDEKVREKVETVIVEGHSDTTGAGRQQNLELSQQRSMAVVSQSLTVLQSNESLAACFLELLSATGRGDSHPIDPQNPSSPLNRRVEFRIRVKSGILEEVDRPSTPRVLTR